jgi:hypothetical protein
MLEFERFYAGEARPSIALERLLRAALVQMLFSIRSEWQWLHSTPRLCCYPWIKTIKL